MTPLPAVAPVVVTGVVVGATLVAAAIPCIKDALPSVRCTSVGPSICTSVSDHIGESIGNFLGVGG